MKKATLDTNLDNLSREELVALVQTLSTQIAETQSPAPVPPRKFGLVWEDKPEEVAELCETKLPVLTEVTERHIPRRKQDGTLIADDGSNLPTHLIIEGDNYHALSVLNYTHAGKIDVIYIDPPYNTGAKDWKYNNNYVDSEDGYRHSKWLSFMEKRLVLAKDLLTENGVLICAIDENELHRLGLLLEEIFGTNYEYHCVTIVHNPRGIQGTNFSYINEFAIFVVPKGKKIIGSRKIQDSEIDWRNLRDNGGESLRSDAKNCFYPIIVKNDQVVGFGDVLFDEHIHPTQNEVHDDYIYIYPVDVQGIERKWRYARQTVESVKDLLRIKRTKNRLEIEIGKNFGTYRTVWQEARYDSNEYGKKLVGNILPNCDFSFPKSLWNTFDCIYAVVANNPSAKILDFFAGSGTTGHAVLELNAADGGNRQFILCTNNENGIAENVTFPRIQKVIEGYADKESIPAEVRYFKTDFVEKESPPRITDEDRINFTARAGAMIAVKENCFNLVEHNKTWQIFENHEKWVAIYFQESKSQMPKLIKKIGDRPCVLYIFSWEPNEYTHEYTTDTIEVKDIPAPILGLYQRIHGRKK